jgi:hypothetical protein
MSEESEASMTHVFEQQQRPASQIFLKSAPMPQHGRKIDPAAAKLTEQRSFQPRTGH